MGQIRYPYEVPTCYRLHCLKLGTNIQIMSSQMFLPPHLSSTADAKVAETPIDFYVAQVLSNPDAEYALYQYYHRKR
jgi:hypothetical protein